MTKSTEIAEIGKNPGGRPAFEVTPEVLEKVETLANQGLWKKQIAAILGISYHTYNEKTKEFPKLPDAYASGRAKGIGDATKALFKKVEEGDVPAIKHFLKHRDKEHWGDVQVTEHSGYISSEKPKDITDDMTEKQAAEAYALEVLEQE